MQIKRVILRPLLFLVAVLLSCSNYLGQDVGDNDGGRVVLTVITEKIGQIQRDNKQRAIELAYLYITVSADGEIPRIDTISLSGNGQHIIVKDIDSLTPNKTWQVLATTVDSVNVVIHTGGVLFDVKPNETTPVSLNLFTLYSELTANYFPIPDSVNRVILEIDAGIVKDTAFAQQQLKDDTISLNYDYISASVQGVAHLVAMRVYGRLWGDQYLLYEGDTNIVVFSGQDIGYHVVLDYVGPPDPPFGKASLTVVLGSVGKILVNGEINVHEDTTSYGRTYHLGADEYVLDADSTSDGGYILAGNSVGVNTDGWLVKATFTGDTTWARKYGGPGQDTVHAVIQCSDGGFVAAGAFDSSGTKGMEACVFKVDANGGLVWFKTFGGVGHQSLFDLYELNDGSFLACGINEGNLSILKITASGIYVWSRNYPDGIGRAITQVFMSDFVVVGTKTVTNSNSHDMWLLYLTDTNGDTSFTRTYGYSGIEQAYGVFVCNDLSFIITGKTESVGMGKADVCMIKVDNNGTYQWGKTWGGSENDIGYGVVQDSKGCFLVAGVTESMGGGGMDGVVVKYTPSGVFKWQKVFGGSGTDGAFCAVMLRNNRVAVCGGQTIAGSIDFWREIF